MYNTPSIRRAFFLLLLSAATLAFGWVLAPFFGAIMWAVILALLFHPFNQWLQQRLRGMGTLAALITVGLCVLIVIVPIVAIGSSLVADILSFIQRVQGGQIDFHGYYESVLSALPAWARGWLGDLDLFRIDQVFDKIATGVLQGGQLVVRHSVQLGQNTFQLVVGFIVMLYLLFFFLRDGIALSDRIRDAIPLERRQTQFLLSKFTTVVRATVRGNVVIALIQGLLGGLAFWVLGLAGALFWGVVMAGLSLLPAVGAALVWAPAAVYLLATGSIWQGSALIAWGVLVIGLSDNILRPILVGRDTKLPDYLVLLSTLGGMALMGLNGFVIGPTIAAMFVACWALFVRRREPDGAEPPEAP